MPLTGTAIRKEILSLSYHGGAPHIGSALSCADIMAATYNCVNVGEPKQEDFVILSKGHAAVTQYGALYLLGKIDKKTYASFAQDDSPLPEHPIKDLVSGIRVTSGSLGHGLSLGIGIAKGCALKSLPQQVIVILSDGECNEGSVWEAALLAPTLQLVNITVIIDKNNWQATQRSAEVTQLEPLKDKWSAFGWDAVEVDGHDQSLIEDSIRRKAVKPKAIVANTIKGKGISFMEDDNNWHYKLLDESTYQAALTELEG